MTTTAAPAPAPSASTSAQPSAVARANAARPIIDDGGGDDGGDPRDAARAELAKRKSDRRLRLVQRTDEDAADPSDVVDAVIPPDDDDDAGGEADSNVDDSDEAEPEQTPSWAAKLKEQVAEAEKREEQWSGEVERIKAHHATLTHANEDLSADVAHYKRLYESCAEYLSKYIGKNGRPLLDPREIELAEGKRKHAALERQLKRGAASTGQDTAAKAGAQISDRFNAYRTKHPEMDWTKNPDAKAFVTELLAEPLPKNLDRLVQMFVAEQRFKRSQKKPAAAATPPRPDRPTNSNTAGAPTGGAPRRQRTGDDGYDRDQIKDDIRAARAARLR